MTIGGVGQNYDQLGRMADYIGGKSEGRKVSVKTGERPGNLSISKEGRNMLREMAGQWEPDVDDIGVRKLTIQNTNEVAWEHYMAMRDISSQTLKNGAYTAEDVMKSIMDTYETRYNEIVKEHEKGEREVSYGLTGKVSLTLEEDLAGLQEAYKMRMANLKGYLTCQQTNKAVKTAKIDSNFIKE